MEIKLENGVSLSYSQPKKGFEILKDANVPNAKRVLVMSVNGVTKELNSVVNEDATIKFYTFDDEEGKRAYRHTCSHILAQAITNIYPTVKLAIGPSIENGFYYDFDFLTSIGREEFEKIETEMKNIIKANFPIERLKYSKEEAEKYLMSKQQTYKLELLADLPENEEITFYKQGEFQDLCSGPHLTSTGKIKAFKLTSLTGAYWRGSEKNKMLTRIYGTAFEKESQLDEYLQKLEEAKLRDHNKLGRDLELFMTDENIGQGLALLMPKGAKVVQILERFVEDEEERRGYIFTKTPLLTKPNLFETSGHLAHYKDKMFCCNPDTDEELYLRPMTCPFQFTIYNNGIKSYRDLPLRYSETSTLFRKEASGEMHGLIRLRQFTLSDGHIVCTKKQLESEFKGAFDLVKFMLDTFGLTDDVTFRFSRWDPNNAKKYIGTKKEWEHTEKIMENLLKKAGIKYEEGWGEAAFYGPKLDVQLKNVHGKEDTIITIQIDFALAKRFQMTYINENGEKSIPYIIHRSSIGCYERTLAMLIEKYNGAFPVWFAPEQVKILSLTDRTADKVLEYKNELLKYNIRVGTDLRNEKLGKKIRDARLERIPYILVVGDAEAEKNIVSVRNRETGDMGTMSLSDFIKIINEDIVSKKH